MKRFLLFWYDCLYGFNLLFGAVYKSGSFLIKVICWIMKECIQMIMVLVSMKEQFRLPYWKGKYNEDL